jgi:DNA-binding NarL/FixJ family response regulator
VLAGTAAKTVRTKNAKFVNGVEPTFDETANRNRDVRVVVVDVDELGVSIVHDLHVVFPSVKIVALAAGPKTMAAALKAGAKVVLPRSTPPAKLAKIIQQLAKTRAL